jgi:hypothetical protein
MHYRQVRAHFLGTDRRLPAGEIEALVLDQLRALLRQPEVVVGTWRAAQEEEEEADITEEDTRLRS